MVQPLNFTAKAYNLKLPAQLHDRVHPYVRMHQKGEQRQSKGVETAPFARQLDFWAVAVALAVSLELAPDAAAATTKFVDTRAVEFPEWLGSLMCILAVDAYGTEDARIQDAGAVIELANQYAAAGAPRLLDLLDKSFPGLPLHALLAKLSEEASRRAPIPEPNS